MVAIPPVPVPVPVPLAFQACQLPKTNKADFNHVLEHVTILGTPSQRLRIRATSGAMTDNNLLYIDKELLLKTVTATTTVMSEIKLKALKRWTKSALACLAAPGIVEVKQPITTHTVAKVR